MSNINCPFDGNLCPEMQSRFDAWQKKVLQTDGMVFQVNPDTFSDCPIPHPQERQKRCERYRGCLVAINNANAIMQELAQYKIYEQR